MLIILSIISFLSGILFGLLIFTKLSEWKAEKEIQKIRDEHNNIYLEIESLIGTRSVFFLGRFNDNISFRITTLTSGVIDMILFFDKKDVSLFKKNECIYGSHYADKNIIKNICSKLENQFSTDIRDCVKIFGNIIDRKTVSRINPGIEFPPAFPVDPPKTYTIDDILDRIGEVGINNLDEDEKRFLEQYQKNQK